MKSPNRVSFIVEWIARISNSRLSVREYFRRFQVPFSQRQYFLYKRQWQQSGVGAVPDGRAGGNHRKLSAEAEGFLAGYVRTHPQASLEEVQGLVEVRFNTVVSKSALSRALKRVGVSLTGQRAAVVRKDYSPFGGFELVVALACHLRWPQSTAEIIRTQLKRLKRSRAKGWAQPGDGRGRDGRGRFTPRYNRRKDVRESRFASIEHKRGTIFCVISSCRAKTSFSSRSYRSAHRCPPVVASTN